MGMESARRRRGSETLQKSRTAESDKGRKETETSPFTKTRTPIRRVSHRAASQLKFAARGAFFTPEICGLGNLFFIFN